MIYLLCQCCVHVLSQVKYPNCGKENQFNQTSPGGSEYTRKRHMIEDTHTQAVQHGDSRNPKPSDTYNTRNQAPRHLADELPHALQRLQVVLRLVKLLPRALDVIPHCKQANPRQNHETLDHGKRRERGREGLGVLTSAEAGVELLVLHELAAVLGPDHLRVRHGHASDRRLCSLS